VLDSDEVFETVPTPDHTVVVMTRGEQDLQSYRAGAWRSSKYQPGTIGITPGATINRLRRRVNRDAGAAHKINIYIPSSLFTEASDQLGGTADHKRIVDVTSLGHVDATVRHTALALLRAMRNGAPDMYAESAIRWLVLHLVTFASGRADGVGGPQCGSVSDRRLRRALDCIEQRYAEPISTAELAGIAGVSAFHFSRLFHQATGSSPYQRLLEVRLEAATRMLEQTDIPVAEVARHCGFSRANYFSTQFRSRFGLSPRDFRRGRVARV
jgi:AraC family transcriptional regulator